MVLRIVTLLLLVGFCLEGELNSQVSLPYYSGFDSPAERNGWEIYRLGDMTASSWAVATFNCYSEPACVSHDYSPSTGIGVVDDWYVSPGFLIPAGGVLDSVRYAFTGFSVPAEGDTIGVYLLLGTQDPAAASQIIELEEFRNDEYQPDNVFRLLSAISLPATNEIAFIGLRYRNAEASSRWLHVRFDNIAVSETTTSVEKPISENQITVYPNPAADIITVKHHETGGHVLIYDQSGMVLQQSSLNKAQTSTILCLEHLPLGMYTLVIVYPDGLESTSIVRL